MCFPLNTVNLRMMEDWKMSNSAQTSASSRIAALLDENSFVEVGAYIAARNTDFNMTEQETPADGVVTGYGTIGGCLVYVYSQDAAVLGGSMGEMHAKKICNIYSMAMKMGAPVIGLVDCAGLRLQEATDALDGFGKLYLSQTMASGVIPQIMAIFGTCGGGMAVSAGMADFTFMEDTSAKLFVNSPNAWRAITRQNVILLPLSSRQKSLVWLISQVMKHLYYPRSVHWYLSCLLTMKKICLKLTAQTI
mgnify:CR=1 FL=1